MQAELIKQMQQYCADRVTIDTKHFGALISNQNAHTFAIILREHCAAIGLKAIVRMRAHAGYPYKREVYMFKSGKK